MKLTMLGTGNALVTECYNTCFLLEDRGQLFLTDGQTEAALPEAEPGAVYEVRARAKVDGVTAIIGLPSAFYGEYSDTLTIPVP